jgi:Flp pilus assembly protein CpaB
MNSLRIILIVIVAVVGLSLLRLRPWDRSAEHRAPSTEHASAASQGQREHLTVGFLPVT